MTLLGLGPRDVITLVREAQTPPVAGVILVLGPAADAVAGVLGAGADPGTVQTVGDPSQVDALLFAGTGPPSPGDLAALRAATRAGVPIAAVRGRDDPPLPYVLSGNVVDATDVSSPPLDRLADRLVAATGGMIPTGVPALREAGRRRLVLESAVAAGWLAASSEGGSKLPALALLQARLLRRLDARRAESASGDLASAAKLAGPELALALGLGLGARTARRRLAVGGRLLDAAVAVGATLALGTVASRARSG